MQPSPLLASVMLTVAFANAAPVAAVPLSCPEDASVDAVPPEPTAPVAALLPPSEVPLEASPPPQPHTNKVPAARSVPPTWDSVDFMRIPFKYLVEMSGNSIKTPRQDDCLACGQNDSLNFVAEGIGRQTARCEYARGRDGGVRTDWALSMAG